MSTSTFKRYEKKYILTEHQMEKLLKEVQQHMNPDSYCKNGRRYSIYNIYYDTEDNSLIWHSLSKPYYKEKLRLRSYKPFQNPEDMVFLEMKKKIGGIVSKRRVKLTLSAAIDFLEQGKRPFSENRFDHQVLDEIEFFLETNPVAPKTYISYERLAFFGKTAPSFRLTIDQNINAGRSSNLKALLSDGLYIMEIKINDSIPLWLSESLSSLNIRRISFSKYGAEYKNFLLSSKGASYALEPKSHKIATPLSELIFANKERSLTHA